MIDLANPQCAELIGQIRCVVQRLALVSHAPIQGYEFAPAEFREPDRWRKSDRRPPPAYVGSHRLPGGDTSIPRGDVDWIGDRTFEYRQKSADYFQKQIDRWTASKYVYTAADLASMLKDVVAALEDWMKTPEVSGGAELEPARGSFLWKCAIADDDRPVEKVKELYDPISKATIYRYRLKYRGLRKTKAV